jgi:chorismate synthase
VTTKHSHGPNFGKKVDDCPRCEELKSGAEPVRWALSRRQQDEQRAAEIRAHDCKASGCSIVCTFGDW